MDVLKRYGFGATRLAAFQALVAEHDTLRTARPEAVRPRPRSQPRHGVAQRA